MSSTARATYHHGDLRRAMLMQGVELARTGGPEAVTLREVSRRLGVSHNALYRHYADREALVEAVAAHGFEAMARAIRQQMAAVPADLDEQAAAMTRLRCCGRGYVQYALRQPGLFRTMFSYHEQPPEDMRSGVDDPSADTFGLLLSSLDELVRVGILDPANRPLSEFSAWSAVHGLSTLFIDGPLRGIPKKDRQEILERMLDVIADGLDDRTD